MVMPAPPFMGRARFGTCRASGPVMLWLMFVATACLLGLGVASAAQAKSRAGSKFSGLTNADLRLGFADKRLAGDGDLSDQVTLRAYLKDGTKIYLRFLATNAFTADADAELKANVERPGQKLLTGKVRRKGGAWATSADRLNARLSHSRFDIRVGSGSFRFRHKSFDLDLEIRTSFKPTRPAGGRVGDGSDDFYVTTILAPRAVLTGTLTVHSGPGAGETDLSGVAYVEHRMGTIEPYNLAQSWVNVRTMDSERTLVSSAFRRPKDEGGSLHGWMLYATAKGVEFMAPAIGVKERGHKKDRKTDYSVPRSLDYTRKNGAKIGTVKVTKLVKRRDDLSALGSMARFVVERVMKPWTFEFDASFNFTSPGGVSGSTELIYQRIN